MNGKKKEIYFFAVIVCAIVMIAGAAFLIKRNTMVDENIVTRYEWLEMLGELCIRAVHRINCNENNRRKQIADLS